MTEEAKKNAGTCTYQYSPEYVRPGQQVLNMIKAAEKAGVPLTPMEITLSVDLTILDKLDEIVRAIRSNTEKKV